MYWRSAESCRVNDPVWPQPNKLFCESCAVKMKLSKVEKPAPTWKVPVGRSLTCTVTWMRSSALPFLVVTSTVSKKPSACTRCLLSFKATPEKSSPS